MSEAPEHVNVLVLGAGMGGLCAAARLAVAGEKPLLIERTDRVGGRASSFQKDGYTINTGAVAIEFGGVMEDTFRERRRRASSAIPRTRQCLQDQGQDDQSCQGRMGFPARQDHQERREARDRAEQRAQGRVSRGSVDPRAVDRQRDLQPDGAPPVPQPRCGDLCRQRRRDPSQGVPYLLHGEGGVPSLRLPSRGHDRCLPSTVGRGRSRRRPGMARSEAIHLHADGGWSPVRDPPGRRGR